ncbi:hypothetical protein [Subtercola frigoramans]|uniref:Uncharacterized protein n=1 Tax=Subtercola frigoramans TaxID=120298 RepID=A0ABS2L0N5_9MICO|nr:hypothetical protein [Subtercola frigoramans]MBM7470628.1 hypothetical protein [Subtercola frigoramans]
MQIHKVHVDGQTFILTAGQDVSALKDSIVGALKDGAGFVEFETVGRGIVAVLITPNLPVRFETVERTVDQVSAWEEHPPMIEDSQSFDFDSFFDHLSP